MPGVLCVPVVFLTCRLAGFNFLRTSTHERLPSAAGCQSVLANWTALGQTVAHSRRKLLLEAKYTLIGTRVYQKGDYFVVAVVCLQVSKRELNIQQNN